VSDIGIDALVRAATRVAAGEPLTGDLLKQEAVPVSLRLVLATAVLAAADRPVNKHAVTDLAPAARSAVYRDHAELLDQVTAHLPAFVQAQLLTAAPGVSVTDLARQLQQANATIAEERIKREEAELRLLHVASYARELQWQLKPEFDAIVREKAEKVRQLRPVVRDGDPATDPTRPNPSTKR
jgi:hypothetical protein